MLPGKHQYASLQTCIAQSPRMCPRKTALSISSPMRTCVLTEPHTAPSHIILRSQLFPHACMHACCIYSRAAFSAENAVRWPSPMACCQKSSPLGFKLPELRICSVTADDGRRSIRFICTATACALIGRPSSSLSFRGVPINRASGLTDLTALVARTEAILQRMMFQPICACIQSLHTWLPFHDAVWAWHACMVDSGEDACAVCSADSELTGLLHACSSTLEEGAVPAHS